jgi:hypothetical protein
MAILSFPKTAHHFDDDHGADHENRQQRHRVNGHSIIGD